MLSVARLFNGEIGSYSRLEVGNYRKPTSADNRCGVSEFEHKSSRCTSVAMTTRPQQTLFLLATWKIEGLETLLYNIRTFQLEIEPDRALHIHTTWDRLPPYL